MQNVAAWYPVYDQTHFSQIAMPEMHKPVAEIKERLSKGKSISFTTSIWTNRRFFDL